MSTVGGQAKTAPGHSTTRSHTIDATTERRPIAAKPHQPSFAEREAMLLLDKISEINKLEKAPKQPCQKLELKRFVDEMNCVTEQSPKVKTTVVLNKVAPAADSKETADTKQAP